MVIAVRTALVWRAQGLALVLLAPVLLALPLACRGWSRDNPLDPGRCAAPCPDAQFCIEGQCQDPNVPQSDGPSLSSQAAPQLMVQTLAGTGLAGLVNGAAATAQFKEPRGIALGTAGLYVADAAAHSIRLLANGQVSTVAGTGEEGFQDGAAATARLSWPTGLAVVPGAAGDELYIADAGNQRIRLLRNRQMSTVAGTGAAGAQDGPVASATFNHPAGLAVAGGSLWVTDQTGCRLRRIELQRGEVSSVAGSTCGHANGAALEAQLSAPLGLALAADGTTYLCEQGNHTVAQLAAGTVRTFAGSGARGYRDGALREAQFIEPRMIASDAAGKLYVTDGSNRIRLIDGDHVRTLAGSATAGYRDGKAVEAQFDGPYGIAVDSAGKVYVAESINRRIRVIALVEGSS